MSKTPEGLVLDNCKKILKTLELQGKVRHWDRLEVGLHMNMQGYMQQHGRKGSSDLLAFVPVDELMFVFFFEVKRPDGGRQNDNQKEFEGKFKGFNNVTYAIITDHKQIKQWVEEALSKSKDYGKIPDGILPESVGV